MMSILLGIAALATVVLGLVYIVVPQKMYVFDSQYHRGDSSKPSKKRVWLYRLLGIGLLIIGFPRLI